MFRLVLRPLLRTPRAACSRRWHSSLPPQERLTVAVGMSGGVDSSVSAYILKQAGFNVVGVFMRNWDSSDEAGTGTCSITEDLKSAEAVCKQLDIPLHSVDFIRDYWTHVFHPFLDAYASGQTPNPDVFCNRHIKFGAFRDYVARTLGADLLATGHYAQLQPSITSARRSELALQHRSDHPELAPQLVAAEDGIKDQSDFLSLVPGSALKGVMFPVGGLPKPRVRALAREAGLLTHQRKDSYGICFIGKRDLSQFLSSYIPLTPGWFVDITTGRWVGQHSGCETLTVGQGAKIGGANSRYFVAGRVAAGVVAQGLEPFLREMNTRSTAGSRRGRTARQAQQQPQQQHPPQQQPQVAPPKACYGQPGPMGTVLVAVDRTHPAVLFDSLTIAYNKFNWNSASGSAPAGLREAEQRAAHRAAQRAAGQASAAGDTAAAAAPMWLPFHYRIRHRQNELGSCQATVLWRSEYEAWMTTCIQVGYLKHIQQQEASIAPTTAATGAAGTDAGPSFPAPATVASLGSVRWGLGAPPRVDLLPPAAAAQTDVAPVCTVLPGGGKPVAQAPEAQAAVALPLTSAGCVGADPAMLRLQASELYSGSAFDFTRRRLRESTVVGAALQGQQAVGVDELLLVLQFSQMPQRAVAAGQVTVLYGLEPVPAEAHALHSSNSPGTARDAASSAGELAEEAATVWAGANKPCLGGGVVLSAGPSYWDCFREKPQVWMN